MEEVNRALVALRDAVALQWQRRAEKPFNESYVMIEELSFPTTASNEVSSKRLQYAEGSYTFEHTSSSFSGLAIFRVTARVPTSIEPVFFYMSMETRSLDTSRTRQMNLCQILQLAQEHKTPFVNVVMGSNTNASQRSRKNSGIIAPFLAAASNAAKCLPTISLISGTGARGSNALLCGALRRVVLVDVPDCAYSVESLSSIAEGGACKSLDAAHLSGAGDVYWRVKAEQEGFERILGYLELVITSTTAGMRQEALENIDPIEREIKYVPGMNHDPRWLCAGRPTLHGLEPGILDVGTFTEFRAGFAKAAVVGRGRLGGIPVGVVLSENRTTTKHLDEEGKPIDFPPNSVSEAGQVWFPDSARKTYEALRDFAQEGLKAILIVANWRGFSGGMRDMYKEILKEGSRIVDALVACEAHDVSVLTYIPPFGELRGGSWVVIDKQIAPNNIVVFADPTSKMNIIEPAGFCKVKFRDNREVTQTIKRLDEQIIEWQRQIDESESADEKLSLQSLIVKRVDELMPDYKRVALKFAELQDTPYRAVKKGVIQDVLPFTETRMRIYWSFQRRMAVYALRRRYVTLSPSTALSEAERCIMAWAKDDGVDIDDDMKVAQWAQQYGQESHKVAAFSHRFAVVRRTHIQSRVLELASNSSTARSTVAALAALQSSCGVPRRLSVAVQGNTTKPRSVSVDAFSVSTGPSTNGSPTPFSPGPEILTRRRRCVSSTGARKSR
ncbi:acetyl-CoA carboxylase 2, putative [Perkinsus marinus ATCC 50983]|uniref:Acetyl-CoA carboxylase 2, putative n=1 Tax=Perkinsus marinus (strain ATCC 50983 / TXsc) TaxID=423536 RepID=C5LJP5_PERM5|nr:acetyl-CoA carboxylase 2, putative [Perkinsus marinus ATCC 50983]EER03062.1 acetyl-CoA carboxylase 2, putative [Perkinsus marinus ATCC 50983]|eukprot:XP_002771246.1 acetyl-CoA carboxylase 2, putative [Perkinsus marinus ATCC 50983]